MSVRAWIDTGRLQYVTLWLVGMGLFVMGMFDVSVGGFGTDTLPELAAVFFAASAAYASRSERIEVGRLEFVTLVTLGTGLLVAALLDVPLAGIAADRVPLLAAAVFAISGIFLNAAGDETCTGGLRRLRGSDAAAE